MLGIRINQGIRRYNRSFITCSRLLQQKPVTTTTTNDSNIKKEEDDELLNHAIELSKIQEDINSTTSSLYTPRDPLTITSNRELIQQRIESIAKKLEEQRIKEEEKLEEMIQKEYEELMRPKLSDYKRPITTFFLLASATYLAIQYLWWNLEGEEIIEKKEIRIRELEGKIQDLLDEQRDIVNGNYSINKLDGNESNNKRKWFSLWRN